MPTRISPRSGYVFVDALFAILIMTTLAGVLIAAIHGEETSSKYMDDSRAATRLAESALTALQTGQQVPKPANSSQRITLRVLPTSPQLAGQSWVLVRGSVKGRAAELIGLVPQTSPATTQGGAQ